VRNPDQHERQRRVPFTLFQSRFGVVGPTVFFFGESARH